MFSSDAAQVRVTHTRPPNRPSRSPLCHFVDLREIRRKYIGSFLFFVDLLAILPMELLAFTQDGHDRWHAVSFYRLNRLVKAVRVGFVFGAFAVGFIGCRSSLVRFCLILSREGGLAGGLICSVATRVGCP